MQLIRGRSTGWSLALLIGLLAAFPSVPAHAAPPAVVNVPSEVATIQAAIDAVAAGGTVLVAPGIYQERLDFHGRDVEVRSTGGPLKTVIDGGGNGSVVAFHRGETRAAVLHGFTVRNGLVGIVAGEASPTISGNIVTGNGPHDGAGVLLVGSSALVEDNVVRGNTTGESGWGGGFYLNVAGGAEIVGNTIEDNTAGGGGGMAMWSAGDPMVVNNVFRRNRAGSGGAIEFANYNDPFILQNVFVDNQAGQGGALEITTIVGQQGPVVANNTMVGNKADRGSAVRASGEWFAANNIITGPPEVEVIRCERGTGRFFYNDVYNGTVAPYLGCTDPTGIVGNISADPRLAADYSLLSGSPAIDAGHDDPLRPLARATDLNDHPRIVDGDGDGVGALDMGAFEWPGGGVAPEDGSAYHPLRPARILDSRVAVGMPARLGPGASATVQVTGQGGVPATGVSAVVLNVTVTEPTAGSFLTVWPSGEPRPLASNLNFVAGQTIPNAVMVKVGAGGRIDLFNLAGSVHVIADVAGWYGPQAVAPGATFTALPPARILDTRTGNGAPAARLGPGNVLPLQVTGRGGVPTSGVSAVVLNVTVTEPNAVSFLTLWPTGEAFPLASNLNYGPGSTVANLVVVKVGPTGAVHLLNNAGSTHVIADVAGWFGGPTSSPQGTYTPVVPARVLDTRSGLGAPQARVGPEGTVSLLVAGQAGIPANAAAVALNVTVTEPTAVSFLTAWPSGTSRPLASNLNYVASQTVPNLVVVRLDPGGKVDLFNYAGSAHVIADVAGWFAG